jgi:hypothetical protein
MPASPASLDRAAQKANHPSRAMVFKFQKIRISPHLLLADVMPASPVSLDRAAATPGVPAARGLGRPLRGYGTKSLALMSPRETLTVLHQVYGYRTARTFLRNDRPRLKKNLNSPTTDETPASKYAAI